MNTVQNTQSGFFSSASSICVKTPNPHRIGCSSAPFSNPHTPKASRKAAQENASAYRHAAYGKSVKNFSLPVQLMIHLSFTHNTRDLEGYPGQQ